MVSINWTAAHKRESVILENGDEVHYRYDAQNKRIYKKQIINTLDANDEPITEIIETLLFVRIKIFRILGFT
ncbi:MAG: hypothetical protein JJT94_16600 [Bernardetiaceae bacterium]|nr:hypothetical protein [Bernardetiaceae bacterium]